jgi:hypothetical protein
MYRRRSYRRHRLRARQTVVWFLVAAAFSQFAFALALESVAPKIRDPEYGRKLEHLQKQIAADPQRPRIVAIGSSRTLNGLRPERLAAAEVAVFNFGLTAHGPVRQAVAFNRLLRDGVHPTAVTIEVMPEMLPWGPIEMDLAPSVTYTWRDVEFLTDQCLRSPAFALDWCGVRAAPAYASRFPLLNHVFPAWMSANTRQDHIWGLTTDDGWLEARRKGSMQPGEVRATTRETVRSWVQRFHVSADARQAFHVTLARCRAENIGAALILMPEASWFRAITPPEGEPKLQAFLATLSRDFGVFVVDARNWCPDEEFFLDGHHLLATGADRFTERFGHEVLAPLVPSRP